MESVDDQLWRWLAGLVRLCEDLLPPALTTVKIAVFLVAAGRKDPANSGYYSDTGFGALHFRPVDVEPRA